MNYQGHVDRVQRAMQACLGEQRLSGLYLPSPLQACQAGLAFPLHWHLGLPENPVLALVRVDTQIGVAGLELALAREHVAHMRGLFAALQPPSSMPREFEARIRLRTEGLPDRQGLVQRTLVELLEPLLADWEIHFAFAGLLLRPLEEPRNLEVLEVHVLGVEVSDPIADILDLLQEVLSLGLDLYEALALLIDQVLDHLHHQNHRLV